MNEIDFISITFYYHRKRGEFIKIYRKVFKNLTVIKAMGHTEQ